VTRELERVCATDVSPAELGRVKAWILGQYEVEMQRRSRIASQLAFDEALALPLGHRLEYPARIERVTARRVRTLARELFDRPGFVTSIVCGPRVRVPASSSLR
jgi:predicted Zn-dependent peptidase